MGIVVRRFLTGLFCISLIAWGLMRYVAGPFARSMTPNPGPDHLILAWIISVVLLIVAVGSAFLLVAISTALGEWVEDRVLRVVRAREMRRRQTLDVLAQTKEPVELYGVYPSPRRLRGVRK